MHRTNFARGFSELHAPVLRGLVTRRVVDQLERHDGRVSMQPAGVAEAVADQARTTHGCTTVRSRWRDRLRQRVQFVTDCDEHARQPRSSFRRLPAVRTGHAFGAVPGLDSEGFPLPVSGHARDDVEWSVGYLTVTAHDDDCTDDDDRTQQAGHSTAQGEHDLIDPVQASFPLEHDYRLERASAARV